ncbi:MAG: AmmeMemoRadiSam system radical SAM enzyme [Eubacterium sp.]|nr:AmmeMemoRadiSam system radical SAM enzyme [Eubacterium sp.]
MARCNVCFRHCDIKEGGIGFCGARTVKNGVVTARNYGMLTGIMLDPIEKKPISRFYPGSRILSVGSYGCNLRCPFCQNYEISWSEDALSMPDQKRRRELIEISPEELADLAEAYKNRGNIGVAFTYNEPLIGYEFVRDTAKLVKERGMKTVLVSNGTAEIEILEEILPYIDAMNIDLKGFSDDYYEKLLGGSRSMVMNFIERAVPDCHMELTTLIIPGENDSEQEIRELSGWIASLKDKEGNVIGTEIPLHISRFFPRFKMTDRDATEVKKIYRLADVAREKLKYVYTGNC